MAVKIVNKQVPLGLENKRIVSLDISSLLAGAKYRGDFEERFKKCLIEAKKDNNVILFIDELRSIIGTGSAEGAMDAANILKPYLSRGDIKIIGATTIEEYTKYIEKDSALNRRFQIVNIEEPTEKQAIDILRSSKAKYEAYHNVKITTDAIIKAVKLSIRYIPERRLPDKAIDIIDEACAKVKFKVEKLAVETLDSKEELKQKILQIKNKETKKQTNKIEGKDIEEIVSKWSKIPVESISTDEKQKLKQLESNIKKKVIGQDEAVSSLVKAIKRNRAGLRDSKKPIASLLFTGPTGVGKTEIVKVLAETLLDDKNNIIRIDMSEYMESHSVSKLIGAPPGYVGYSQGGLLTEAVRRRPYSIILFDEIEKAHVDVYNILLQVLDDGRLTDSEGRAVDFKNTICIMTSNIGARKITENKHVGFISSTKDQEYIKMKDEVLKEVKKKFSPEFLNRLDEIIVFRKLSKDSIKKIVKLLLKEVEQRAKEQSFKIEYDNEIIEYVSQVGFDEKMGARPLKRTIQSKIEDKLADLVIENKIKAGDKIKVSYSKQKNKVIFKKEGQSKSDDKNTENTVKEKAI